MVTLEMWLPLMGAVEVLDSQMKKPKGGHTKDDSLLAEEEGRKVSSMDQWVGGEPWRWRIVAASGRREWMEPSHIYMCVCGFVCYG